MFTLLQAAGREAAQLPSGYGVALLQTLLALGAVCILAWVVLGWGARRGFGLGRAFSKGRVRVLERVSLDARRSLYLVELGDKVLLIGAGDSGAPAVLSEVDPQKLPPLPDTPSLSFAEILKRITGTRKPPE